MKLIHVHLTKKKPPLKKENSPDVTLQQPDTLLINLMPRAPLLLGKEGKGQRPWGRG